MCYRFNNLLALVAVCLVCGIGSYANGQDVIYLKKSSGDGETKRKGEIVGWVGDTISIKGKTGVKDFGTDRLIRFETAWHPGYEEGKALQAVWRYDEAIKGYASALEDEPRAWMQNIVHARLVECFLAKEDFGNAASQFRKLIDDDPQSRFRHLAPLVWTSSRPNTQQLKQAELWLDSSEPMLAMLGASWLLGSSEKATQRMRRLSHGFDPLETALAKAQLWRSEKVAPNEKRMAIRIDQTRKMPEKVRCGAWYLIAEAQTKLGKEDDAIVNFMRIAINDPEQGVLAVASLYQAAELLKRTNRGQQSQALRNELKEKFGDTIWAQ